VRLGGSRRCPLGPWKWPLLFLAGLYFLVTVILPIVTLVLVSFMRFITPDFSASVCTLDNYSGLFSRDTTRLALQNTVVLAVVVASVGSRLALLLGYAIVRTSVATMQRIGIELDEAAAVGGAPLWRRLLHVIGPMALPSLVAIWRTLFILSVLEVDVLIFLYQGTLVTVSVLTFVLLDQGFSPAVFPLAVVQVGMARWWSS